MLPDVAEQKTSVPSGTLEGDNPTNLTDEQKLALQKSINPMVGVPVIPANPMQAMAPAGAGPITNAVTSMGALAGAPSAVTPTGTGQAPVAVPVPAPVAVPSLITQKTTPMPKPTMAGQPSTPSIKDMATNVLYSPPASGVGKTPIPGASPFVTMLKGAGGRLGDFLQRWGMGLAGAPTGQTQGDIQRAQQFELAKTQMVAQVQAQQMAMENNYQEQRQRLQSQLNMENLPKEKALDLQNQLQVLDAGMARRREAFNESLQMWRMERGADKGNQSALTWMQPGGGQ